MQRVLTMILRDSESIAFFKMVQNKLHYAAHGHTAAERYIRARGCESQPFYGIEEFFLVTFLL